jgi:hypothetical protein
MPTFFGLSGLPDTSDNPTTDQVISFTDANGNPISPVNLSSGNSSSTNNNWIMLAIVAVTIWWLVRKG